LTPKKVITERAEHTERKDKCEENSKRDESKGDRRKNSMKRLFPARLNSSNEEALNEFPPYHDEESSQDVNTLSHIININLQ
jgi:hypothetical protein